MNPNRHQIYIVVVDQKEEALCGGGSKKSRERVCSVIGNQLML